MYVYSFIIMRLNELLKEISNFNEVNIDLHENKLVYHDKKKRLLHVSKRYLCICIFWMYKYKHKYIYVCAVAGRRHFITNCGRGHLLISLRASISLLLKPRTLGNFFIHTFLCFVL